MSAEYIIYCDESDEKGRHYSNFYGGILVRSRDIDRARQTIADAKEQLNMFGEAKWQKVTGNYAEKYKTLMDVFFRLVREDLIKVRIMFTQNTIVARNLSKRHIEEQYFILYYEFIKHAFGLRFAPPIAGGADVRILLDQLPDTAEQVAKFKLYLMGLNSSASLRRCGLRFKEENIVEVASHDHALMQCLDIVLGAMQFRLNNKHLEKPQGERLRGKRTRAKEKVYKHINVTIREIYPNFNIGASTGHQNDPANRWHHPYRHWLFKPTDHIIRPGSKWDKGGAP